MLFQDITHPIETIALVACSITTALYQRDENISAAKATIPLIFLFFLFYNIAYTPILVAYTLEILPFRIRAKGFAVMVSRSVVDVAVYVRA